MAGFYQPDYLGKIKALLSWTLPQVYTDNLTNVELLNRVVWFLNEKNTPVINQIQETLKLTTEEIHAICEYLEKLTKVLNDFQDGRVPQSYIEAISKWLDQNLQCVVNRTVKFFSFGIDDAGHVYVDMPYTWRWLDISWDMEYGTDTFGHIELKW